MAAAASLCPHWLLEKHPWTLYAIIRCNGAPNITVCLLHRSDKAFMTTSEIEAKQRQQRELQLELDRQVQEKQRQKVRAGLARLAHIACTTD